MRDAPAAGVPAPSRLQRAVWRWHFYAGLLVAPVLAWLALTGAVFLFPQAIDRVAHAGLKVVAPLATPAVPASRQLDAALAEVPGRVLRYTTPVAPDASAEVLVQGADGARRVVYVDPWRGEALGVLPERGTWSWTVRRLHSLDLLGPWANAIVEIAAGWAIVLVLTGAWLWWPRGRLRDALAVPGAPRERRWWRGLHGVLGLGAGGVLLFLALSGLPWSLVWGQQANRLANGHDAGYPAGVRVDLPLSDLTLAQTGDPAWSMQRARVPRSPSAVDPHAAHGGGGDAGASAGGDAAIDGPGPDGRWPGMRDIDAVVAALDARGLAPGWTLALPAAPDGVFTGSIYPADLERQRVVHLDAYAGAVLLDMGYRDYGPLGRGLEWVINIHLGQEWGLANQLALLVACLGIVALCASGVAMWWMRRPRGRLGLPPPPAPGTLRVVTGVLAVGGLAFPLTGASMLAIWALDRWLVAPRLH